MEFESAVNLVVKKLTESGKVEEIITAQLEKTISSVMSSLFSEYGDFGKQIKVAVGTKLNLQLEKMNIDLYTTMVINSIENVVNGTVLESHKDRIVSQVLTCLGQLNKKEWLMSEVVLKYRESLPGENSKVDFEYRQESYGNYIQIGEQGNHRHGISKDHQYTIHCDRKEGRVFAVTNRGQKLDPRNEHPGRFDVFLMQLWVNECIIIEDVDVAEMVAEREEEY